MVGHTDGQYGQTAGLIYFLAIFSKTLFLDSIPGNSFTWHAGHDTKLISLHCIQIRSPSGLQIYFHLNANENEKQFLLLNMLSYITCENII